MLLKLNLLFVSVLLTLSYGFSQADYGTIKGTVTDSDTKQPIAFCQVVLKSGEQIKGGANTDFDGNFQINSISPGTYDVEIRNATEGYQPQVLEGVVVSSGKITFLYDLTMGKAKNVQDVEEMVVVAYKVPLIDRDGGASGATITREDIARLPVRSAAAVAGTVGGVNQSEGSGAISVRGSRSDGTYFYIDGIKVRGSSNLPKSAIEEVTVITGGLPANYGDATGGIISVTTRGPSAQYFGSIEGVTSGFYVNGSDPDGYNGNVYGLDKFGYNLVEGMFSGPLWMQKDSTGRKTKPRLGFLVSANYTDQIDSRPLNGGSYRIKKESRDEILAAPLVRVGDEILYSTNYLQEDDFELVDWRMNARNHSFSAQGKIDVNTGPSVNLSFGGSMNYGWGSIYNRTGSLMNFSNFGAFKSLDWRVFGRLTQRFTNNEEGSSSKIKSAYYTLMVDFSKTKDDNFDPKHGYNLFNYGHVGRFDIDRRIGYSASPSENGPVQEAIPFESQVRFTPSETNPQLAAQTAQYFSLFDYADWWQAEQNYRNLNQVQQGNGLRNGDGPQGIYNVWNNIGTPYNGFGKTETDQIRVSGAGAVNIGDHSISLGFEYEQRYDRGWTSGTTTNGGGNGPMGLWTIARQLTNGHLTQLNTDQPNYIDSNGTVYTSYDPLNTGYAYTSGTGQHGGDQNNDEQSFFDYNLRSYLMDNGMITSGVDGLEYINIDQYDPNIFSLDMFSPDELLNSGNSFVSYWGYDHTGNKVRGQTDINKYFNEFDENGNYRRFVGAFQPTYIAGYVMDKFSFRDIVFNVGVRVDVYDANQPVLKDPYLIYNAKTVREARQELANDPSLDWIDIPGSMGDDFVVYVNDNNNPSGIKGFRSGDTWYDATGTEVTNIQVIESESEGGVLPYLQNPGQTAPNADAFEDYKAQVSIMPRVSFSFPISDEASFFAHYDILTKRPTAGTRFDPFQYQFLSDRSAIVNNSNLLPEKTIDYELGFQQVVTRTSSVKISAFYREQRDQVQLINVTGAYPRQYRTFGNRDFGTVKGMTISYDMRRTGNIRMTANYTLQFADGTGSDATSSSGIIQAGLPNLRTIAPYDFDQRHAFAVTFDYRYGEGADYNGPVIKGFNVLQNTGLNIVSNIYSGSPYSAQTTITNEGVFSPQGSGLSGSQNGSRLPWSYRLDLQLDRNFNLTIGKGEKKRATFLNVYVRVTNLFNQFNVLGVYRATGNWDDDGFLEAAQWQTSIQNSADEEAFRNYYAMKVQNPFNVSAPRTIRLGVKFDF